jgi:hypothetical protein
MKKERKKFISLFMIFLFIGSTIAYGFMRGFRREETQSTNLPKTNIIEYELTEEQETYLIQRGVTIVKFYHSEGCIKCLEWKNELENIANKVPRQLLLEEINSDENRIEMFSLRGSVTLTNPTKEEILKNVCNILWDPPGWCLEYTL